jgi:hypothetical protein
MLFWIVALSLKCAERATFGIEIAEDDGFFVRFCIRAGLSFYQW